MKHSSIRGLTLVELMVAIAILVIALSIGMPGFQGATHSGRLSSTANELSGTLQLGRAEAIRRNQRVVLCRSDDLAACADSEDAWTGWILFADDDGDDELDAGEEVLRSGRASEGVTIHASEAIVDRANRVSFPPTGLAAGANARALLNATLRVCAAATRPAENARDVGVAFGSRIAITPRNTGGSCAQPADS